MEPIKEIMASDYKATKIPFGISPKSFFGKLYSDFKNWHRSRVARRAAKEYWRLVETTVLASKVNRSINFELICNLTGGHPVVVLGDGHQGVFGMYTPNKEAFILIPKFTTPSFAIPLCPSYPVYKDAAIAALAAAHVYSKYEKQNKFASAPWAELENLKPILIL